MNRRFAHKLWAKVRLLNPWYFLIIAIVSGIICVFALRDNNLHMITLRNQVYEADKSNGDVETALRNLREYVYAHMNTDLSSDNNGIKPPIQLKYRYERLVEAEKQRTASQNDKIYTQAQQDCERRFPVGLSGSGRIPCVQEYIASHTLGHQAIPDALYKFDFVSPRWSPDLAGWSMVIAILSFVLFAVSYIAERWLQSELHD